MQHSNKQVAVKAQKLPFYFNRIPTPGGIKYCVSVEDKEGKTRLFHMVQMQGHLTNPINFLHWILALEAQLSSIIAEHERAIS